MTVTIRTQHLNFDQCRAYIKKNCKKISKGFWEVESDLKVWKKTTTRAGTALVALRIPKGATVFMLSPSRANWRDRDDRKMRASEAFVEKQYWTDGIFSCNLSNDTFILNHLKEVQETCSMRHSSFKYCTGHKVVPKYFADEPKQCTHGIHFFVSLSDALLY